MKKLFLGIFVFAVISFAITGLLIKQKKYNNFVDKTIENNNNSGETKEDNNINENTKNENNGVQQVKEKTIDINGTYDQNDLKIEEVTDHNEIIGSDIKYPQINGLKNKDVEKKINEDIKLKVNNKFEKIYREYNINNINPYMSIKSNFANVISITVDFGYLLNDKYIHEYICLNYELLNGESLKFEDLFVQNVDLNNIVRRILYRTVTQEEAWNFDVYDIEFDKEKSEWTAMTWKLDENGNGYDERDIYIPKLNEYEIYKIMNKFMKSEDKQFSFTPAELELKIEDSEHTHSIKFLDIAEDVVIYDKYLTKESVFENENIGLKNIFTCSVPLNNDNRFLEYGFAKDNLFYEISEGYMFIEPNYPFEKSLNTLKMQALIESRNIIEKYKQIAENNPDKFYILSINQQPEANNDTNIMQISLSKKIGYISIENKEKVIADIKDSFRYHNVVFYGSGLALYFERNEYYESYTKLEKIEGESYKKVYDARDLREITAERDVFKDNIDYEKILNEIFKDELRIHWYYEIYTDEKINELMANAYYEVDIYGITMKIPNEQYDVSLGYNKIGKEYLTVYDLTPLFILETDRRVYDSIEIEQLSIEELNLAYNEIFARHGHDFKNNELKAYFDKLSWYNPIQDKTVSIEELSEIERTNLNTIKKEIEKKK